MEYDVIIRFFGILIISLYIYMRILNIKDVSKLKIVSAVMFSLIVSVPLSLTLPLFQTLILPVVVFIYVGIATKVRKGLMITSIIISVGICLGIDMISQTILFIPMTLFTALLVVIKMVQENITSANYEEIAKTVDIKLVNTVLSCASFFLSILLVNIIFKIKRLKKGFVFLQQIENRLIGIVFSIIIFICTIYTDIRVGYLEEYSQIKPGDISLIFFILIAINVCTLGIHFWWRHHTTVLYQQRLKEQIIQEYQAEIDEKDRQIKNLSECNNFLSETAHRDNKLIPAMFNAVSNLIYNSDKNAEAETKMKGMHILSELDEIMQERKEMILKIQREHKPLPSTEMERIDNILNYMFLKASENEIQFDFAMAGSIKNIAESVIPKQKLETLLADLIENAIIAASYSTYKKILVSMGIVDDCYEINVQDSGIPFEVDTLIDLGLKKSTTHADEGGSGIGYITVFKILGESNASLIIMEHEPENYTFSKSIKVRFDGKSEFVIYSFRAEKIKPPMEREGLFILDVIEKSGRT